MRIKRFGICIAALCASAAVSAATETGDKEPFWLGGDISGMNATRLRVWVNPKHGFCSPEDVLKMAKRSQALGMPVMIDFHYSDWWADPGKQNPPEAWVGMTLEQTKKALADHTRQTLQLLKTEAHRAAIQIPNLFILILFAFCTKIIKIPQSTKKRSGKFPDRSVLKILTLISRLLSSCER